VQLTQQQQHHFRTFGFLIFRQLFSSDEVASYSREFDAGLGAWIGDMAAGQARVWAPLMDANTPFITSLIDDPRFADVAEQLLGRPVIGILTDGNYYVGDTAWHPDNRSPIVSALKFTIYADPLDARTGALRVIPGSHRQPLHGQIERDVEAAFGVRADELPAFTFESTPGDVLVFDQRLWHASFGGSNHRRMGIVDFHDDPQTPEEVDEFQKRLRGHYKGFADRWAGHEHYPAYWRSVGGQRHQRWVRRLAELGLLDTPQPA